MTISRALFAFVVLASGAATAQAYPPTLSRDESTQLPPAEIIHRSLVGLEDRIAAVAPTPRGLEGIALNEITFYTRPYATPFAVCMRDNLVVRFGPTAADGAAEPTRASPMTASSVAATHSYMLPGPPTGRYQMGDPHDLVSPEAAARCAQVPADDARFFGANNARDAVIGGGLLYAAVDAAKADAPSVKACEKALKGCAAKLAGVGDASRIIGSVTPCAADWRHGIDNCWDVSTPDRIWRLEADTNYKLVRVTPAPEIVVTDE
jgi:hypothetical protein